MVTSRPNNCKSISQYLLPTGPKPSGSAAYPRHVDVISPTPCRFVTRADASSLLETADLGRLGPGDLELSWRPATQLCTWNRLDLGFKMRYLELLDSDPDRAIAFYAADIGAQSFDTFTEYTDHTKNSLVAYHRRFVQIYRAIADGSFDWDRRPVLTARDGSVLNGAHRVAAAVVLGLDVRCLRADLDPYLADWRLFRNRAVPRALIEAAVAAFVAIAPDCRLGVDTRWQRHMEAIVYRRGDLVIYQSDRDAPGLATLTREPTEMTRLLTSSRPVSATLADRWWRVSYLGLRRRARISHWVRTHYRALRTADG